MRIALSGSHRVGKTTLAELLIDTLTRYEFVAEPYHLLLEEGNEFAEIPSAEDFEQQLARSVECIRESGADTVFDRCPLDMLGYLVVHRDADKADIGDLLPDIREAVAMLDLVVFVQVETPDRIEVPPSERPFRMDVDAALWDIIVDDAYGLGIDVTTVTGSPEDRLHQVLARLNDTEMPQ